MKNAAEWERLNTQNREDFCNQIFTVLQNESQKHIKQSIAVMIGRLYRVAPWRDCMPTLFDMISSDQDHKVLSALKVLSEIFESGDYSQHKTKFHELFTKTLTNPNHKVQKATIATLALFCNNHDEQHVKIFKDLSGPIFEAFKNIIGKQPDSVSIIISLMQGQKHLYKHTRPCRVSPQVLLKGEGNPPTLSQHHRGAHRRFKRPEARASGPPGRPPRAPP
jgi:hypothetical protein